MSERYHLAQANLARMRAPLEDPVMEDFRKQLDAINAAADHSPGFVWRLQTDAGDATDVRIHDDERILFNASVWTTLEDLRFYVYRGAHAGPFRERRRWFDPSGSASVLWWVPAGHRPTVEEAMERLGLLERHGPTPEAFTFQTHFPPPE